MFKFKVYIEVFHNDRDIEFFEFKSIVNHTIEIMKYNIKTLSCEMISNYIYKIISDIYSGRSMKIEVSEDGENGIEYNYK